MNDFINFSNNNINNNSIKCNDKINSSKPIMIFSLKNVSTAYNSQLSNDSHLSKFIEKNNGKKPQKIDLSDLFQKKNNRLIFKTSSNYYRKKNYKKYLNIPQSPSGSIYVDSNNNSYFRKNSYNKTNYNKNLNSNFEDKKIYNKLNIKELIEITQKRKKIIEEKKKESQMKKQMILKEEEKFSNIITGSEFNIENKYNENKCEEGVQTSMKIKEEKKIDQNVQDELNNENRIENNSNNININLNLNFKNVEKLKESKNTDFDLVNIGEETEENINIENSNKNMPDVDLKFDIVNNETIVPNKQSNEVEDTISFERTNKFNEYKGQNINDKQYNNNDDENVSKTSSVKDNEMTEVEEYDKNKFDIQNETKSIAFENFNDSNKYEENIDLNLQLSKSKNKFSIEKNRYEDIDCKNSNNLINGNLDSNSKEKNSIENNHKLKNYNISKSTTKIKNNILQKDNVSARKKLKLNSFNGRLNKNNNKEKNNKTLISTNTKEKNSSLSINNINKNSINSNFKTNGFKRKNSSIIQLKLNDEYTNKNDKKSKMIILQKKENDLDENKKFNKTKKKRQLDNYTEYYKQKAINKEALNSKINFG